MMKGNTMARENAERHAGGGSGGGDDEDLLVVPAQWREVMHPRRGKLGGVDVQVPGHTGDVAALAALYTGVTESSFAGQRTTPHIAEAMRRQLGGAPSPLGTAALSLLTAADGTETMPAHLDAWIAACGLPFAAATTVEAARLYVVKPRNDHPAAVFEAERLGLPRFMAATARRARTYLAASSDEAYAAVVRELGEHRREMRERVFVSYLLPDESDWLIEACKEVARSKAGAANWRPLIALLHCSVSRPEHLAALRKRKTFNAATSDIGVLTTAAEGLGGAVVELFSPLLGSHISTTTLGVFARLPYDEAFALLTARLTQKYVQAAAIEAARLFPRRAIRLLATAACAQGENAEAARLLLTAHLARHDDRLLAAVHPSLGPAERALVDEICARAQGRPEAAESELPAILVDPPWTHKRPRGAAVAPAAGGFGDPVALQPSAICEVRWSPDERAKFAGRRHPKPLSNPSDLAEAIARFERDGTTGNSYLDWNVLLGAPEAEARRALGALRGVHGPNMDRDGYSALLARFDIDAIEPILRAEGGNPAYRAALLQPVVDVRVARLMADWLLRLKGETRTEAERWLTRHPADAAVLLTPDALGSEAKPRAAALYTLRYLAGSVGCDVVEAARGGYGGDTAMALKTILDVDPLELVPARPPKLADWLAETPLPQILLPGRERALPAKAVRHLLTMLAISRPGEPYAGIEVVTGCTDPASLAAFGRALLSAWRAVDYPGREVWILWAQAALGDEETVQFLAPLIPLWPKDGGHRRAQIGLEVLAEIGTPYAHLLLFQVTRSAPRRSINHSARQTLARLAQDSGLTADQLIDRLLPDFGLDGEAGLWLDYGPRRIRVEYDERLRPVCRGENAGAATDGGRLPAPAPDDDLELVEAARRRLDRLNEEVRLLTAHAVQRMESSMVMDRAWTAAEFRSLLLGHPLLWPLTCRVVWLSEVDGVGTAFRVAEDRGFADVHDDEFTLPEEAVVRVAHPLRLGNGLGKWAELFADYEILQPFPQLGRPVYALTEAERAADALTRFAGATVPNTEVRALLDREWGGASEQSYGTQRHLVRPTADGRWLSLALAPGLDIGAAVEAEEPQLLGTVTLESSRDAALRTRQPAPGEPLQGLDPITASELLGDLYRMSDR